MMRCGSILVLTLAALAASCRPGPSATDLSGKAAEGPSGPEPVATIAVAAAADGCATRWNGEPVNQTTIAERSITTLEQAIQAGGGGNAIITEENLPVVRVEAAAGLAYACIGATLRTLQHSGFPWVALRPTGGDRDAHADFFFETVAETGTPPGNIAIGRGSLAWNGTPTDLAGVRTHIQALARGGAEAPPGMADLQSSLVAGPPNDVVVTVARDVAFGELHALLRAIEEAGQRGTLRSCAGPAAAQGQTIPGC